MAAIPQPARALSGALLVLTFAAGCADPSATASVGAPTTAAPLASDAASPSASDQPPPAPASPSAVSLDTSGWRPFTSERYGYTVSHPRSWTATPATGDWTFETSRAFNSSDADQIIDRGASYAILFTAFSAVVPEGMSHDAWIAAYYEGTTEGCDPMAHSTATTVDRLPAVIAQDCNDSQAFVSRGDSIQVFAVWRANQQPLLTTFLKTVAFAD